MRNQEGGGPPLRFTQQRTVTTAHAVTTNNNNNNNASVQDNNLTNAPNAAGGAAGQANNNNGGAGGASGGGGGNQVLRREVTRAGGFNFAGFRFRFGVVLTTHQPQRQQPPGAPSSQPTASAQPQPSEPNTAQPQPVEPPPSPDQPPLSSGDGSSVEAIETNEIRQEASITSNAESSSGNSQQIEAAAPTEATAPVVSTTSSKSIEQKPRIENQQVEASETIRGDDTQLNEAAEAIEVSNSSEAGKLSVPVTEIESTLADVAKDLREVSETLKPYVATTEFKEADEKFSVPETENGAGKVSLPERETEANEGQSGSFESDETNVVDVTENTTEN